MPRRSKTRVQPLLQADVERFERWAAEGRIERVDFTHLIFVLWGSTQAYADLGPQFAPSWTSRCWTTGLCARPRR